MAEQAPVLGAVVADTSPAAAPDGEPLIGRHVKLELTKESDIPVLYQSVGKHDDLWTHWPAGPYSASEWDEQLKELIAMPALTAYTVFVQGEALGLFFLESTDLPSRVMETGMAFGPRLQRTRAGTEAVFLGASLSFDKLNNRRLEWKTDSLNLASHHAAKRYGLSFEGSLRQHRIYKGRNRDTHWYSMIDSEWPVCKRAFEAWLDDSNFDEQGSQKRSLGDIRKSIDSYKWEGQSFTMKDETL